MRTHYLDEFEVFAEAYNRTVFLHRSGREPWLDLEPVYDRYGDLFRRDAIEELWAESRDAFTERGRKGARRLLAEAVDHHLAASVRALTEEISTHDARATVDWGGAEVPFHATAGLLARLARAEDRRELARRRERIVREVDDLRAERFEKVLAGAAELAGVFEGAPASYAVLRAELRGAAWADLAAGGARLLAATERAFVDAAEAAFREHTDVRLGAAASSDVPRLFAFEAFDTVFRGARLRVAYRDVFAGLRIRTAAQENVSVDLAGRVAKHPRAHCAPVRVPDDVRISVRPRGGYGDFRDLVRAGGHAQQFAFTSPETRVEFRRPGRGAAGEAFALLIESVVREPAWLERRLGLPRAARAFRPLAALERAAFARGLAGLAVYQEELYSGRVSLAAAPSRYAELMAEATGVEAGSAEHLAALDEDLPAPERLLAAAVEAQIREHLKVRFGSRWWDERAAGELLKEIWSAGAEYSAEEIAAELGLGEVSLDPLEAELVEGLGE